MINGDLNDLLDREIQKVALPSKKIAMGASTHPSSMSKSPLEAYTDPIDMRGAMPSVQDSSVSQRSSFDDTFNTVTFNEISNKGRHNDSSCEESKDIGNGLINEINKSKSSEEHLSSEEETLTYEAYSEIKNLLTTKNIFQHSAESRRKSKFVPLEEDSDDVKSNDKEIGLQS